MSVLQAINGSTGATTTLTNLTMALSALNAGSDILVDGALATKGEQSTTGGGKAWFINGSPVASFFPSSSTTTTTSTAGTGSTGLPSTPQVSVSASPGAGSDTSFLVIAGIVLLLLVFGE